jgi:hypothetical protein
MELKKQEPKQDKLAATNKSANTRETVENKSKEKGEDAAGEQEDEQVLELDGKEAEEIFQ